MKVRRYFIGSMVCAVFGLAVHAQNVNTSMTPGSATAIPALSPTTNVYQKQNIIPEKKPVPYSYIREADVMWAKDTWRTIDLRQRMNIPLRYPLEGKMADGDRYSLFGLLIEGILTEEITPYEYVPNVGWKDPFSKVTNMKRIYELAGGDSIPDDEGNLLEIRYDGANVMQFEIQEQWFFDKQHSVMKVRIVALAPVYYERYDEFNQELPVPRPQIPFIVYFPQCRRLFATHAVYNPNNDAQEISFDDLFFQRRFDSTIIAESNVYGNRPLTSYKLGQDVLLEAEKIKKDLLIMEHDLWEY